MIPLIGLPMETKVRDLDGRLYLAMHLAASGFSCCMGHRRSVQQYLIKEGGPFAYVDKGGSANSTRKALFRRMQERGGLLIRMDEEGGVYAENCIALMHRNPPDIVDMSSKTFLWGDWQKSELLKNERSFDAGKIAVVGNPRFDLCRRQFAPYFLEQQKDTRFKGDPYVLINTSFQRANHYLGAEKLKELRSKAMGKAYNVQHENMLHYYHELLSGFFIKAVRAMAREISPRRIVIRPHPTESLEFYRTTFSGIENVHVIREGPVQKWLVNAAAVIHHGCTTAIESFVHGLPVAMFAPIYHPELAKPLPMAISDQITEEAQLIAWVQRALEGSYALSVEVRAEREKALQPVIAKLDGSSTQAIVEHLSDLLFDRPGEQIIAPIKKQEEISRAYRNFVGELRKRGLTGRQSISRYKFGGLKADELTERIEALKLVEPDLPRVSITEVGADVYRMEADS